MSCFIVFGVEEVYDAFDEYEHSNPVQQPFTVEADSVEAVVKKGEAALYQQIKRDRERKGFLSSGWFLPRVIQVVHESGELVMNEQESLKRVWPFEQDETSLIPKDGLPTRVCFMSYNSADQLFSSRLVRELCTRRFLCWFAPDRPDMPAQDPNLRIEDREDDALLRARIAEGIACSKVVLVIVSKRSTTSEWVEFEVLEAIRHNREKSRPAIVGLQIDQIEISKKWHEVLTSQLRVRDFSQWRNGEAFTEAVSRLKNELDALFAPFGT